MITDRLLAKYPIISDQVDTKELGALLRELEKVLQSGAAGNIVEFGGYWTPIILLVSFMFTIRLLAYQKKLKQTTALPASSSKLANCWRRAKPSSKTLKRPD